MRSIAELTQGERDTFDAFLRMGMSEPAALEATLNPNGESVTDTQLPWGPEPGELSIAELKQHPIYELLRNVQAGLEPTAVELNELRLPTVNQPELIDACQELIELRGNGEFGMAQKRFPDSAAAIIGKLPRRLQDPSYLRSAQPEITDPRKLAAGVARI